MIEKISECERIARRRIRYISPLNAGKVLAHRRYWTLPFLKLYLEACDEKIFEDPEEGYLLCQHAPELARRIEVHGNTETGESTAWSYGDPAEKRSWRVRALAVWGSSCRAYGEFTQAEAAYRLATELAGEGVDAESFGELRLRAAVLAFARYDDGAAQLLDLAIDDFTASACRARLADAWVVRGALRIRDMDPRGLVDSARALELADTASTRGRRTMVGALHNMAIAATRGTSSIESQEVAHRLLQTVKRRLANKPRSLTKMRIFWVEGLLLAKMGITRLAEKRLTRVRDGLEQLGAPLAFVLASLDLAAILASDGGVDAARALASDTALRAREMASDPAFLRVIDRWVGAKSPSAGLCFELQDAAVASMASSARPGVLADATAVGWGVRRAAGVAAAR
ncbi:MAG: hypothetical protein AAGM22_03185 [Acidobacteriota bacterium]